MDSGHDWTEDDFGNFLLQTSQEDNLALFDENEFIEGRNTNREASTEDIDWDESFSSNNEEEKVAVAELEQQNINEPDDEENKKKFSRFIKFTEKEKENFVRGQRNNNTMFKTDGHIRLFVEFLQEQNENRTVENIEPVKLNSYMEKGQRKLPANIFAVHVHSIRRYLKEKKYPTDLKGPAFNDLMRFFVPKTR